MPGPTPGASRALRARVVPFPPEGGLRIQYRVPAGEGVLYRLQLEYSGYSQVQTEDQLNEPRRVSEDRKLELHYRQRATAAPSEEEIASILIMSALRQQHMTSQGPSQQILEVADDRMRLQQNGEDQVDTVGSPRRPGRGPDALLGRPFAILLSDPQGNPLSVDVRGRPGARAVLNMVPLQAALRFAQPAFPPDEVVPGDTWQVRRIPASPVGSLGLTLDVEYRLIAYEELDGVQCARVLIRAALAAEDHETPLGFALDSVSAELNGEAWLDVATGQPYRLVMEDEITVRYEQGESPRKTYGRMSFSERVILDRLDSPPRADSWADGSKRFSSK